MVGTVVVGTVVRAVSKKLLESLAALKVGPGGIVNIYNFDLHNDGVRAEHLQRYYDVCRQCVGLHVTTSCFTTWRQNKKTNAYGKVIPTTSSSGSSTSPSYRVFFFDDNLELDGVEAGPGICNLRDVEEGTFVDFAEGKNGYQTGRAGRHTIVMHSAEYNGVLVKANILDAIEDQECGPEEVRESAGKTEGAGEVEFVASQRDALREQLRVAVAKHQALEHLVSSLTSQCDAPARQLQGQNMHEAEGKFEHAVWSKILRAELHGESMRQAITDMRMMLGGGGGGPILLVATSLLPAAWCTLVAMRQAYRRVRGIRPQGHQPFVMRRAMVEDIASGRVSFAFPPRDGPILKVIQKLAMAREREAMADQHRLRWLLDAWWRMVPRDGSSHGTGLEEQLTRIDELL
ncbi:unnamed protein product [Prorocentrum cordatum]|uniref:Uncharacterized protein n=1 Tax=Prorocentrum cordatum TaxID=2364126 RepID=A0ABN9XNW9_9DINO|nr:unnamed protein product [Polarella glacialis]